MSTKIDLRGVTFLWANNLERAFELIELGWSFAEQRPSHHHFHACLMRWDGEGEPKLVADRLG